MKTFFRILETVVRPFFIYILIMNLNFQVVNGEEKDSTFFSTVDLPAYNSEISLVERLNQTGIKYEVNSLENYSSYESNYVLTIGNQEGTRKIYVVTPVLGEKNSKTIDTVVEVGIPNELKTSSSTTSVTMTARKMHIKSLKENICGWKIP